MSNRRRGISATSLLAIPVIAAMAFMASAPPARAATSVSTMAVTAAVTATCTSAITTLPFGAYTGVVLDVTATVTVTCTDTTPYNVGLDYGVNTTGAPARDMILGGVDLPYTLSTDAAHTINWGNTVGGADGDATVAGTGNGAAQPLIIYGEIPAGELIAPGTYTDTITATVTY